MACCAAALGKDELTNQGRPSWLEVAQAGQERPQVRHLVALKNRRIDPLLAGLTKHRRGVVPQNACELPRRKRKIMLWAQFRSHTATLPTCGMALDAFALEHGPAPFWIAWCSCCVCRWVGSAGTHVRDQIIHFVTLKLGPLSDRSGDGNNH